MGGRGSGQHDNHRSKYQVAEVQDGEGVPVYVTMQRAGESFIDGLVVSASGGQSTDAVAENAGLPAESPGVARLGRATDSPCGVAAHAIPPRGSGEDGRQLAE